MTLYLSKSNKVISFFLVVNGEVVLSVSSNERLLYKKFYVYFLPKYLKIKDYKRAPSTKIMEDFLFLVFVERLRKSGFI